MGQAKKGKIRKTPRGHRALKLTERTSHINSTKEIEARLSVTLATWRVTDVRMNSVGVFHPTTVRHPHPQVIHPIISSSRVMAHSSFRFLCWPILIILNPRQTSKTTSSKSIVNDS
jgi:hypothetical protein